MRITSVSFLIFLLLLFAVFYICPVRRRWMVLLAGSVVFYVAAGAVHFLPFILSTSVVIWGCARAISRLYERQEEALKADGLDREAKKAIRERYRAKAKRFLLLALFLCVGILCVTKFTRFAVRYLNLLMGAINGSAPFDAAWVIVPLGISYYTFSAVGYLLDVYWKRYACEPDFLRFFLYVIYFPHILQGPISRYNLLGQELKKELRFDSKRIVSGMELMLWGYFKKLVIADRLSIFVSTVYNGEAHAGSIFLLTMVFDAFQIYTDFSGYMDIVRGVSQIFGVELERNFNHPFFSKTVPEYWRRWHMSLGSWFKDYVYYPCTISPRMRRISKWAKQRFSERFGRLVTVAVPVFVTWILTGLWHGTGKTYLCWGLYYGALITVSTAFQPEFEKLTKVLRIRTDAFSWQLFRMLRTFCCFMGGRLLTSPGSLRNTLMVVRSILSDFQPWCLVDGTVFQYGLDWPQLGLIACSLLVLWGVSMMQERFSVREALGRQNIVFRWIVIYAAIFSILVFGIYGLGYNVQAFLYEIY